MTFFTSTFRNVKKTLKRDTLATLIMFIFCLAKYAASHVWYLPPLNSKLKGDGPHFIYHLAVK